MCMATSSTRSWHELAAARCPCCPFSHQKSASHGRFRVAGFPCSAFHGLNVMSRKFLGQYSTSRKSLLTGSFSSKSRSSNRLCCAETVRERALTVSMHCRAPSRVTKVRHVVNRTRKLYVLPCLPHLSENASCYHCRLRQSPLECGDLSPLSLGPWRKPIGQRNVAVARSASAAKTKRRQVAALQRG